MPLTRHLLASLAGLTALASALASPPPPGSLPPPKDGNEAFDRAGVVFLGTVEAVEKDGNGVPSQARVRVTTCWKGTLAEEVRIDASGPPTYPPLGFEKGKAYLFYLPGGTDPLRADVLLHRVLAEKDAAADIALLKDRPPVPVK